MIRLAYMDIVPLQLAYDDFVLQRVDDAYMLFSLFYPAGKQFFGWNSSF